MTQQSSADTVRTAIGASSLGFGALAVVAPLALAKVFGMGSQPTPDSYYLGRTWGSRTALLGVLSLTAGPEESRRLAVGAAALNALDAAVALTTAGFSMRTRVAAGLTSASYCAAAVYVARAQGPAAAITTVEA
jgi:hypothetical protein